jgi:carbon monoxide dehydrogenase subunit G
VEIRERVAVSAHVDAVWAMITDIPRVAPCIPGAEIDSPLDDNTFAGRVRVKVGPLALALGGTLSVESVEPAARRIVLRGGGRDPRGLGEADATMTITASEDGDASAIEIVTDLRLGGPVAQFGRQGVVTAIVRRLLGEFAACLGESARTMSATEGG